jgi:hypothetical protein
MENRSCVWTVLGQFETPVFTSRHIPRCFLL